MKKGFTLIELLVVVLIIGILSAIALPQYTKAVEKSRLTEGLQYADTMKKNMDMYVLENGYPGNLYLRDLPKVIELTNGSYNEEGAYVTKYFKLYNGCSCFTTGCYCEIYRTPNYDYAFVLDKSKNSTSWTQTCYTEQTDIGKYICKSLESQGWIYQDAEF